MDKMNEKLEQVALKIFDTGAIRFGSFTFKIHEKYSEFPRSPNKINLRIPDNEGNLREELIATIGWEMYKKAISKGVYSHLITGLPKAGEPFARVVAQYMHKPLLQMVKEFYSDGQRRISSIQGDNYQLGQRVLVLDDVISQAQTKLEGIAAIESVGLKVSALIVVIDREEGGAEYLQTLGYRVLSIFSFSDLLKFYYNVGKISQRQLIDSLAYSEKAKKLFLQNLS